MQFSSAQKVDNVLISKEKKTPRPIWGHFKLFCPWTNKHAELVFFAKFPWWSSVYYLTALDQWLLFENSMPGGMQTMAGWFFHHVEMSCVLHVSQVMLRPNLSNCYVLLSLLLTVQQPAVLASDSLDAAQVLVN